MSDCDIPSKQIAMQVGSWFDRKDMTLEQRENAVAELIEAEIARRAHETSGDVMLAQLCAPSATGVHVRKPDGVCVHCGAQANELSNDFARAATLVNDCHGYTIWRIGGHEFVPLDQANEAVRLARGAQKTNGDPAPTKCDVKCLDHPKCECGRGMP
jgi:hypothetical protein